MDSLKTIQIFDISNFSISYKAPLKEKDNNTVSRTNRMKMSFEKNGVRRVVEAVMVVHIHKFPHVLLLQLGNQYNKLPGGKLKADEQEEEGLIRKLENKLMGESNSEGELEIEELIGTWWRPNFDNLMYPYIPPHVSKPKECRLIYLVKLPEKFEFVIPRNLRLVAVPLFDLYDNMTSYGPAISSIPQLLGKYEFIRL